MWDSGWSPDCHAIDGKARMNDLCGKAWKMDQLIHAVNVKNASEGPPITPGLHSSPASFGPPGGAHVGKGSRLEGRGYLVKELVP